MYKRCFTHPDAPPNPPPYSSEPGAPGLSAPPPPVGFQVSSPQANVTTATIVSAPPPPTQVVLVQSTWSCPACKVRQLASAVLLAGEEHQDTSKTLKYIIEKIASIFTTTVDFHPVTNSQCACATSLEKKLTLVDEEMK